MKRIVASVGLVAVGASSVQAALLPALTTESGKPWNLSATLRGFYDDNMNGWGKAFSAPGYERSSLGFEVSPSLQFSFPMEQTTLSFGYVYSFKYYENKPYLNAENYDQTHNFNAALTHAFSERYQISVRDSFVIGQEPDLLMAGNTYTTFQRIAGNNLRNFGSIRFSAQLTPEFGLDAGYANTLYEYTDDAWQNPNGNGTFYRASYSGLLNELDHVFHLDGRYQFQPQTIGVVGYQFRLVNYTADQPIGAYGPFGPYVMSDERDAAMHYGYLGVDHNFRPDLSGSIRLGGRYTDYVNTPVNQNSASPYGLLSLRYTYLPESYVELGASADYSATSQFAFDTASGQLTLSAQAFTVYVALRHRITPKLYGGVIGQFQNSRYYGGPYDSETDKFYLAGLSLQYRFTPNFSAEAGYNFDDLDSQVASSYVRNRVYLGVTGAY